MNIISNNCCAGFIYKNLINQEYKNPFIWTLIYENDFLNLIKNYDRINFNNYTLENMYSKLIEDKGIFYINIDNLVKCYFIHYHFNKLYNTITKIKSDIKYNKIWEYIIKKYNERVLKLKKCNESPIFLIDNQYGCCEHIINESIKICNEKNYKLIIITEDKNKIKTEKLLILHHECKQNLTHKVLTINKEEIINFIGQ